jgi:hypothetical protein
VGALHLFPGALIGDRSVTSPVDIIIFLTGAYLSAGYLQKLHHISYILRGQQALRIV